MKASTNKRDYQITQDNDVSLLCCRWSLSPPWRFYPFPGHGIVLEVFVVTRIGHTALGTTPLDEWSARRRDLYLTTHNTFKIKTFMFPAGFEPTVPTRELPQTHTLGREATGIGLSLFTSLKFKQVECYATSSNVIFMFLCHSFNLLEYW